MKKLVLFAMTVACLSIFNACEKSDDFIDPSVDQETTNNPLFAGLDTIAFSVENNIMVFETEEDYQKCLDFLGTIDIKNYQLFEKEVGFNSLLTSSTRLGQTCPIEDEKFATLLNPQMQIIIENYLFTMKHEEEELEALFIGEDYNLKSININNTQRFSYDNNVFAILKGEQLKSTTTDYCSSNTINHDHYNMIFTRISYQKYGIYNTIKVHLQNYLGEQYRLNYLKIKSIDSPLGQVPTDITSRCFFKRDTYQNNTIYEKTAYNVWKIEKTLYSNTRRLIGYRQDFEFWWKLNSWDPMSYDNIIIECHNY